MVEDSMRPELSPQDQLILGVEQAHKNYLLARRRWFNYHVPHEEVVIARNRRSEVLVDILGSGSDQLPDVGVTHEIKRGEEWLRFQFPPSPSGNKDLPKYLSLRVSDLEAVKADVRDLLPITA